jgi:hypothetical protein
MTDADYQDALAAVADRGQARGSEAVFDAATYGPGPHLPGPGHVRPARPSRIVLVAAAIALVGATTAAVVAHHSRDAVSTSTPAGAASTPSGPLLSIDGGAPPAPPVPAGWQTADEGLGRIAVPANWPVLVGPDTSNACVAGSPFVVLGPFQKMPAGAACAQDDAFVLLTTNDLCGGCVSAGTVNGLEVQRAAGGCDGCSKAYEQVPALRLLIQAQGIDPATLAAILASITLSPQARALADGPLVDTSSFSTQHVSADVALQVPSSWPVHGLTAADGVLAACGGNPIEGHASTILLGQGASAGGADCPPPTGRARPAHPADGIWVRLDPSAAVTSGTVMDPLSASLVRIGPAMVVIDGANAGDHVDLQIDDGGTAVEITVGIGADPALARTILRTITIGGDPLVPDASEPGPSVPSGVTSTAPAPDSTLLPTSAPGTTLQPPPGSGADDTCNRKALPLARSYGDVSSAAWTGPLTSARLVGWLPSAQASVGGIGPEEELHVCIYEGTFSNLRIPAPTQGDVVVEIVSVVLPDGTPHVLEARWASSPPIIPPS